MKGCPVPGCPGTATRGRGGGSISCSEEECEFHSVYLSEECWESLARVEVEPFGTVTQVDDEEAKRVARERIGALLDEMGSFESDTKTRLQTLEQNLTRVMDHLSLPSEPPRPPRDDPEASPGQ